MRGTLPQSILSKTKNKNPKIFQYSSFLTAVCWLCWVIRDVGLLCSSDRVRLSPSIQGTPTASLPWTTSAAPWRWAVSWTEKTHSTQRDSLSPSRWASEEVTAAADQEEAIKPVMCLAAAVASSTTAVLRIKLRLYKLTPVIRWAVS